MMETNELGTFEDDTWWDVVRMMRKVLISQEDWEKNRINQDNCLESEFTWRMAVKWAVHVICVVCISWLLLVKLIVFRL